MTAQPIDKNGILSPEVIDLIALRVIALLRDQAMRQREAKLADLRAHEAMFNLPRTPTSRERGEHSHDT